MTLQFVSGFHLHQMPTGVLLVKKLEIEETKTTVASRYYALDCVAHYRARTLHSTRSVMIIS